MFSLQLWCFIVGTVCALTHDASASECVTREEFESRLLELTESYQRKIEETTDAHQKEINKLQEANAVLVKRVETLEALNHQSNEAAFGEKSEATLIDHEETVIKDDAGKGGKARDEYNDQPVSIDLDKNATTQNKEMETSYRLTVSDKTVNGARKFHRRSENKKNAITRFVVDEVAGRPVAFSVSINAADITSLGLNQIIKFDKIVTNIDNVFDVRIGVFTAPISGYYVFSLAVMINPNEKQYLYVMKDGVHMFHVWAEGTFFNTATKTMVIEVNKGQEVWVQTTGDPGYSHNVHGYEHTAFTGFLLYANDS